MSAKVFSLDNYRAAADKTYGSFKLKINKDVTTEFHNPLRIEEAKRDRVFELIDELTPEQPEKKEGEWQEVGADDEPMSIEDLRKMQPLLVEFLLLVGDKHTPILIDAVGGDFAVLMSIFQDYFSEVGLGEASSSPDA